MRRAGAGLAGLSLLGLLLAGCSAAGSRAAVDAPLLRLEYLERAERLPALLIREIDVPQDQHVGLLSPVVWRVESAEMLDRPLYRQLPVKAVDLLLYDEMLRTMESYGFRVRGWQSPPPLRLRVDVERLVLISNASGVGSRACRLSLRVRIEENPSGLPIEDYRCEAKRELDGSWTVIQGADPIWAPRPGEADPIAQAARAATESFLSQSFSLWQRSERWESMLKISARDPEAARRPPADR